jgi:hypothetical protein
LVDLPAQPTVALNLLFSVFLLRDQMNNNPLVQGFGVSEVTEEESAAARNKARLKNDSSNAVQSLPAASTSLTSSHSPIVRTTRPPGRSLSEPTYRDNVDQQRRGAEVHRRRRWLFIGTDDTGIMLRHEPIHETTLRSSFLVSCPAKRASLTIQQTIELTMVVVGCPPMIVKFQHQLLKN